MLLLVFN